MRPDQLQACGPKTSEPRTIEPRPRPEPPQVEGGEKDVEAPDATPQPAGGMIGEGGGADESHREGGMLGQG